MAILLAPSEEAIEEVDPVMDHAVEWDVLGDFIWDAHYQNGGEIIGDARRGDRAGAATREILRTARDDKAPPPPLRMVSLDDDSVDVAEDPLANVIVLGNAAGGGERDLFPTVRKFFDRFRSGHRVARLDTPESHRQFQGAESPAMAALRADVERLREELHAHVSDPEAHAQAGAAEYAEAVEILGAAVGPSRKRVPLMLPPWAEGKVECWTEDDVICCSIKVPGADGQPRYLSSASPAEKHLVEVIGYARSSGCHIPDVASVLPTVACMMGGGALVATLAAVAPSALARPEARGGAPFVGRIVSATRPSIAALVALRDKARGGSAQAAAEWRNLGDVAAQYPSLAMYMDEAVRS